MKAILCTFLLASTLIGGTTGSISGTIKDPSGAVIPGAIVTVTNTAMGIARKVTADSKGDYAFGTLAVGRYDLEVVADGFRPYTRSGLIINVDSVLHIDSSMEVVEKNE